MDSCVEFRSAVGRGGLGGCRWPGADGAAARKADISANRSPASGHIVFRHVQAIGPTVNCCIGCWRANLPYAGAPPYLVVIVGTWM